METNFLIESVENSLVENSILEENKAKKYFVKGPFLEANVKNRNNRIYPQAIIEKSVNDYQSVIKENRVVGELNHPEGRLEIDPTEIAIKITELNMDKNIALGSAEVLTTPKGMIVRSLMDSNVKLGISSRGYGSLKESVVQSDYKFICMDLVMNPSAHAAWVDNVLEAKTEWVIENGILVEKEVEILENRLKNFNGKKVEDVLRNDITICW
jgi:hypothetical protein